MATPFSDTVTLPGSPPVTTDGADPQFLRELVVTLQQIKTALQSIESNQNARRL